MSRTLASTQTLQLAEIHTLDAFCTPIEERFERITRLGQRALKTPVIGITAVAEGTQWFKSVRGWQIAELRLEQSLCQPVVESGAPLLVADLKNNPKYARHPLVSTGPRFGSYYGFPLFNALEKLIGTIFVADRRPRRLGSSSIQTLEDLAALAERELLTLALHSAQTALISKLSVARRQALLDALTNTWNRRGGTMLLDECIALAAQEKKPIAVLAVDLDNFKQVNDTFGHAAGDAALRMVARQLLSCVRGGDGVCRMGGDEFFVVLTGLSREELQRVAQRVQHAIGAKKLTAKGGRAIKVSASVGTVYSEDPKVGSAEELLAGADADLYEKKLARQMRVDVG